MTKPNELSIAYLERHADSAARVLEQLAQQDAAAFVGEAPQEPVAAVLERMQPARAAAVLSECPAKTAASLLGLMATHSRLGVLLAMTDDAKEAVLTAATKRQAAMMRRYLNYDPGTVGAWMDAPNAVFMSDMTARDCLSRIRGLGARLGSIVCVVDDRQQLHGIIDIDTLLDAADTTPLSELMDPNPVRVLPQSAIASVVSLPAWDSTLSVPVTDRTEKLVGILHFRSVREGLSAERHNERPSQTNLVLVHVAQAMAVSLMGLFQVATTEPRISRLSKKRRT